MRSATAAVLLSLAASAFAVKNIDGLPLGVAFNRASLYAEAADFHCLDGSKVIPWNQVNDDYCDCADGSDEPGTSACPNGKFHCQNKGHSPLDIPSSRVNDRICDCCDGSDEYNGSVECPNICDEIGAAAREEKARRAEIERKGWAARQELAKKGMQLKEEKVNGVAAIRVERDGLKPQLAVLEEAKKAAEAAETAAKDNHRDQWNKVKEEKKAAASLELFKQLDKDADGKISLDEAKQLSALDTNNDGAVDDDEVKAVFHDGADQDYAAFHLQYDFIRRMIRDQKTRERKDKAEQDKADDMVAEELRTDSGEAAGDAPIGHFLPIPPPEPVIDNADDVVIDEDKAESHQEEGEEEEDELEEREPPYPAEIQTLIDEATRARSAWSDMDVKVRDLDGSISDADSFAGQDFGPDMAWAPLKGECFELNEAQYTYKLCPFDRAVQKDRNGYGETSLGTWHEWNGKIPRKYSGQRYEKGQQCWNGPQRSCDVVLECGAENELLDASEPGRCEYRFVFRTPAACNDPDATEPAHTEL